MCAVRSQVCTCLALALGAGLGASSLGAWALATPVTIGASQSATTRPATTKPVQGSKIETIEYDFGQVWMGDPVTHTFEVSNTSNRPLGIRNVDISCGCITITGTWDKQVQPGQVWKLGLSFDTAGRHGNVSKTVIVTTEDPQRPQIDLVLKGEIRPRFEFAPSQGISLGALQSNSTVKRTLVIANKFTEPVVFTLAKTDSIGLKTRLREIEKGKRYELEVETAPPLAVTSSFPAVVLETDLEAEPRVSVPIFGRVQARIELSPRVMPVGYPVTRDLRRDLRVQMADGTTAKVTKVESSNPAIRAVVGPVVANRSQHIQVTFLKGMDMPATSEMLTVHTDDPEFPRLTCEIRPFRLSGAGQSQPAASQPSLPANGFGGGASPG